MAVRVPDTNTFALSDVIPAVEDHAGPIDDKLSVAFANAIDSYFDVAYKGSKDRESNFRNYGPPYCYVSRATYMGEASPTLDASPRGLWFVPTGLIMFVLYFNGTLKRYNLASAWDLSTATFHSSVSLNSAKNYGGLWFSSNGLQFYTINTTDDRVEKWSMSLAYTISSATFSSSFTVSGQDTGMRGLTFKADGTKMYMAGNQYVNTKVYQYNLSTGFDFSTCSFSKSFEIDENHPLVDVRISSDGKKLFTLKQDSNIVRQFNMNTAWEIDSYDFNCFGVTAAAVDEAATGMFIVENTLNLDLYLLGDQYDKVYYFNTEED